MDDEFAREVLRLAEGHTIEDFEEDLRSQAEKLDIAVIPADSDPVIRDSKPPFGLADSHQARRSISSGSRASHSTDITDVSQTSKEHGRSQTRAVRGRRSSATSVSIRDYDAIVNQAKTDLRRISFNVSTSPISPSPSSFSLSNRWSSRSRDSSPRNHLMRGLSRLRLRRTGSSGFFREKDDCPHCPESGSRHRRTLHTLPCGHRYCSLALRKFVKDSLVDDNIPPTCCNRPIPGALVANVVSQEEQDTLMSRLVACEDASSMGSPADDTAIETRARDNSNARQISSVSPSSTLSALTPRDLDQNLDKAMALPGFKILRESQEQQRDDLLRLADKRKSNSTEIYAGRKIQRLPEFARQKDELVETHSKTLAYVEDKHVLDEHDLRNTHETEARNNAIALKHMEAYCRGETTSGESHSRFITDQDLSELTKARRARDQMDARHASAISVLRGEQSRRLSQRILKHEDELAQLEKRHLEELDDLQRECDDLLRDWNEEIKKIRVRMQKWWGVQVEIWRKNLENETGICFKESLPSVTWPDESNKDSKSSPRRNTVMNPLVHDLKSGATTSPSPPRRPHRFSTAFSFRGSLIGKAQG